jgi:hypothetical protein
MSERDRQMAELIAQHTTARMLTALQDEETAGRVFDKWAGKAQQVVGRIVIRTVFYIVGVAVLIGSIKAGAIDWLVATFGYNPPPK